MVRRLYLRFYDRVLRAPMVVLVSVTLVAGAAAGIVPRIGLDMSFRPLFGQSAQDLEPTARFEKLFGQRSGAYIGAIITANPWTSGLLEGIEAASSEAERLDHVSEVLSLARFGVATWDSAGARGEWVFAPTLLDSVSNTELPLVLEALDDPRLERTLVSADGDQTLILARLTLPLEELRARAEVIREFKSTVLRHTHAVAEVHWVGISVVEEAYSRLVLSGLARSLVLTTVMLVAVLWAVFRRAAAVAAIMAGVSLAMPVTLAVMTIRGQSITIVNSMVPTMIMIIGVADAIHMFECFLGHRRDGTGRGAAARAMFGDMAFPCLLTALTTIVGFLALEAARITAIRDFGLNVAFGVTAVYALNMLVLPALLLVLPDHRLVSERSGTSWLDAWRRGSAAMLTRMPGRVAFVSAALIVVCALGAKRLRVDQRFNEDVAPDHPIRVAQTVYERNFRGLLGPDLLISRADGAHVLHDADRERLAGLAAAIEALPGVIHVETVLDHLPAGVEERRAVAGVLALRDDPLIGLRVRDVVDEEATRTVFVIRTSDIGSRQAIEFSGAIERLASGHLGADYEVDIVGQWWLAQLGLQNILRDMLVSFATSFLLVLPLLAITLGNKRLFLAGVLPNVLPMLFALGFMGWIGISVRVGTAMILAIALAIAVDDTIHILVRLKEARERSSDASEHVRSAIEHAGGAVVLTTIVLVAGFLSMRANGLVAIQEMGTVAAATLTVALLADVYLLPATYLLLSRPRLRGDPGALRMPEFRPLRRLLRRATSSDV